MYNLQTHMTVNNYYDRIADIYDRTRWLTDSVAEEVADFILALVNATPETKFLEPSVGTGLNVLPLVRRGYSVTGIDISREMLDRCRQKLPEIPPNLTLVHADASQLPFPDRSFDVALTVSIAMVLCKPWYRLKLSLRFGHILLAELPQNKWPANFRWSWLLL
jgi:ubiquinone/menaquinone biosynthesis C-methylase UbiE